MRIKADLNQIDDNPFQARAEYGDIAELAADILRQSTARPDTLGLQQVPTARLVADDGGMVPIAGLDVDDYLVNGHLRPGWRVQMEFGHRRKRAFAYLFKSGAAEYYAMPLDLRDLEDEQMLDGVWQENRSRRDLSSVEEAELLARKLDQLGNQRAVAEAWGLARPTIANKLALLELPEEIRQANRDGRLSERAALSLAPVVQVQQAINGSAFKWGDTQASAWGAPLSPGKYIDAVIEEGSKITSEGIREYTKRLLAHTGKDLPKCIADMNAQAGGDIIRPGCQGCPKRANTTCLDGICLAAKKEAFKAQVIADAEMVLGIPFSDREEDFVFDKFADKQRVQALWESGERERTNFVFGWRVGETSYRPFWNLEDGPKLTHLSQPFEGDGRLAIVIGHRGFLPVDMLPGGELPPDIASKEQIAQWAKIAQQIKKQCKALALAAIQEAILEDVHEFRTIMGLILSPKAETTEDAEQCAKAFTAWLWDKGDWGSSAYNIRDEVNNMSGMLSRAGISKSALGLTLGDWAILELFQWYSNRDKSWATDRHEASKAAIEALRGQFQAQAGALTIDMQKLKLELDRAARDIEMVMAKAAQV